MSGNYLKAIAKIAKNSARQECGRHCQYDAHFHELAF
jgi:hypothetical protein